jgi:iron complex outermembrane recepter protein
MKKLMNNSMALKASIFPPLLLASAIASASSERFILEEVIVTAQKVPESLQDVPISMSAVDGQKIADAGINNLQTLSGSVPGLQIGTGAVSDNIFIRGIGSGSNKAFEQSVGMYIDGAYMGRSLQYRSPFLDVERVEVLRGPQGVLFGKNTVAGVINITTASPSPGDETTGKVSAEYEPETDSQVYTAMFNTSLTENLGARVALKYRDAEGWVDNALLDNTEPNNEETSARVTLAWYPTDDISTTLKLSHSEMSSSGVPMVLTSGDPVSSNPLDLAALSDFAPFAFGALNAGYPETSGFASKDFTGYKNNNTVRNKEGMDLESNGLVLNVDWGFENFNVASVTAYSEYEYANGVDGDFGPLTFISAGGEQEFDQISQEFRLSTTNEGPVNWTVGAYFEKQSLMTDGTVGVDTSLGQPDYINAATGGFGFTSLATALTGGAYGVDSIYRHGHFEQDAETASAFAQVTWEITPEVRATFGLRYAVDKKTTDKSVVFTDDVLGINRSDADPDGYGDQASLEFLWSKYGTFRHNFNNIKRKSENLTPGLNVEWDLSEDAMVYFSYSEGYKSGGFNAADDMEISNYTTPAEDYEYEDEEVKTFEIGGKFTLAEGSMRLNWALFHTEYTNLQVTSFNGTSFTVGNAAATTIEGVEADWQWQASEYLNVSANIAYLDYAYDEYDTASCNVNAQLQYVLANPGAEAAECSADLSGETGAFAPEWSGALAFQYERPVGDSLTLQLGADANYKDEYYTDDDLSEASLQDATWKYNLRAGLKSLESNWEIMLFGNNITDEQTLASSQDVPSMPGMHIGYVDEGRVWGLRGTYNFE